MSDRYNPNMGFQGRGFQSGDSICKPMDLTEYYNTNYTPMFDGKGGAAKKPSTSKKAKKPSTSKKAKKPSTSKKAKKVPSTKKRGGTDSFEEFSKLNISLPWATQAGGTELASEYYTSAQQGSYAPYNASKDEKCGGGHRGGRNMNGSLSQMEGRRSQNQGSLNAADSATRGGNCGCGYKPKTSGAKRGGSDGYYADTITGDDAVVERKSILDGQLDGGAAKAKKRLSSSSSKGTKKPTKAKSSSKGTKKPTKAKSSSKGTKKPTRKHKGGDDSAGVGSDFATTLASRGPANYPDAKSADLFRIFNKTSEFIPNSMLKYAAAPQSTGYAPDPNPYPRAYNDDFIGGTKKSSSKAKLAKKSTSSSKTKAKPAKKSTSSKTKAKKH
jgi:hypothetical protein